MEKVAVKQTKELDYKTYEAFRALRTNLEHVKQDGKVLAFTSVMGKEGKSFVAFRTACAVAAAGKTCVYVNANLRGAVSSDIYEAASVKNTLAAYLKGEIKENEAVCETDVKNLYLVESGAPCPEASELLGSEGFETLIHALRETYDWVVIDTPAVGEVADGLIAARQADGVVMVMEPEMVPYEEAQKVKKQIEMNGCKVLGVVLNK